MPENLLPSRWVDADPAISVRVLPHRYEMRSRRAHRTWPGQSRSGRIVEHTQGIHGLVQCIVLKRDDHGVPPRVELMRELDPEVSRTAEVTQAGG